MKNTPDNIKEIFRNYNSFIGSSLISLAYSESRAEKMRAKLVFSACNHSLTNNPWRTVEINIVNVLDICAKLKKNDVQRISSGVKLFHVGDLWCLDIDGNYTGGVPSSLKQVRQEGSFYVTGGSVMITEQKEEQIAEHLMKTVSLIKSAYSAGIPDDEYKAVLCILYEHMSDRNLAETMSFYTGRDYAIVYNDVLDVGSKKAAIQNTQLAMDKLINAGLLKWIEEG